MLDWWYIVYRYHVKNQPAKKQKQHTKKREKIQEKISSRMVTKMAVKYVVVFYSETYITD